MANICFDVYGTCTYAETYMKTYASTGHKINPHRLLAMYMFPRYVCHMQANSKQRLVREISMGRNKMEIVTRIGF